MEENSDLTIVEVSELPVDPLAEARLREAERNELCNSIRTRVAGKLNEGL